jgi:hypothetical protein
VTSNACGAACLMRDLSHWHCNALSFSAFGGGGYELFVAERLSQLKNDTPVQLAFGRAHV